MKRIVAVAMVIVLCLMLCACGNSLKGKYVSESGWYSVEFNGNGTCTWYQDGTFFNGTYKKVDSGWQLNINGSGLYSNTIFQVEGNGGMLIITGGVVYEELFTKQ